MQITGPTGLKWLKLIHLICASVWFGCSAALNLLRPFVSAEIPEQARTLAGCALVLDNILIFWGVFGTLITGIIYGACTRWGFFRVLWIRWKWILSLIVLISGTFITGPAIEGNVQEPAWYIANAETYATNLAIVSWSGGIQLLLLFVILYLSVMKPAQKNRRNMQESKAGSPL